MSVTHYFNEFTFVDEIKYLSDVDIEMKLRFSCPTIDSADYANYADHADYAEYADYADYAEYAEYAEYTEYA